MRTIKWLCWWLALSASCGAVAAPSAKIVKVLPHYLDKQGRHTLSPSLYERDAYQAHLRKNPLLCAGLRFDVQWKAKGLSQAPLKMRLELRTSNEYTVKPLVLEEPVKRKGFLGHWVALRVQPDDFKVMGKVVAWRVSLWSGEQHVAEQKSFLWEGGPLKAASPARK